MQQKRREANEFMSKIKIIKPGLLTTVQDLGRYGFQQYGMPVSGAMDFNSLKLANLLVGNDQGEACLEATMNGPTIEFEANTFIAICGADMQPGLNGTALEMYTTIPVKSGDKLSFSSLINGFRTYIAFAGGIYVPVVMGSKSTYLRGKIGGYKGRQLKQNDILNIGNTTKQVHIKYVPLNIRPEYKGSFTARIIAGPENYYFTLKGLDTFIESEFELSRQCDRMGYRLKGEKIEHKSKADIISSGVTFGTIQVPAHGDPIIMMADRQTTGGYPRIANVITEDLPYLAQLKPGDKIRFKEVKLNQLTW